MTNCPDMAIIERQYVTLYTHHNDIYMISLRSDKSKIYLRQFCLITLEIHNLPI